jgi:hypothetical protein
LSSILDPVSKYVVSFVIRKIEFNNMYEYFPGFGCILPYAFFNYITAVIINGIRGILKTDLFHIEVWVPT